MEMKITRRRFAGALGAAAAMPFSLAADEGRPLLKIGVITDTHIGKTKESCARVKLAYEMFREFAPDMIVNVGDIADLHYPTGYVAYREVVEEAYAGVPAEHRPKELFVYAGHDTLYYKPGIRHDFAFDAAAGADMKRLLRATNDPYAEGTVKGFPYIAIPQRGHFVKSDDALLEKMIVNAIAKHPGKPVFVFTHVSPRGTARGTGGDSSLRQVFNRFPQVVVMSGHTHGSLRLERAIWQGEFTSVSAGCLQNWGGGLPGSCVVKRRQNYGALLVEVYADRIAFRRFDVRDRKEYVGDIPWVVPWPHDPASAPFRLEARRKTARVPTFTPDVQEMTIEPDAKPFRSLTVEFPSVKGVARPYAYKIELSRKDDAGAWTVFARRDIHGDFWMRDEERPATVSQTFSAAFFEAGREYRISVIPRNSFGVEGKGIEKTFTAPEPDMSATVVWETDKPMEDCPFCHGIGDKGRRIAAKDGFFALGRGDATLVFPKDVWKGPKGTSFRFTLDMHTIQDMSPCWSIVLRNRKPLSNALPRIRTPLGDSGVMRYVMEFKKPDAAYIYGLLVREGEEGRIRFTHVKIERLPPEKGPMKNASNAKEELDQT